MAPNKQDPLSINQVEAIARRNLPSQVYNYYACGADDETAIDRNKEDFNR